MNEYYNNHYIKVDPEGRITSGWSDGLLPGRDTSNAVLLTEDGIPLYRWDGERVVRRSEEEVQADRAAVPPPAPSAQEQLRADVDFLAAMQGVTL